MLCPEICANYPSFNCYGSKSGFGKGLSFRHCCNLKKQHATLWHLVESTYNLLACCNWDGKSSVKVFVNALASIHEPCLCVNAVTLFENLSNKIAHGAHGNNLWHIYSENSRTRCSKSINLEDLYLKVNPTSVGVGRVCFALWNLKWSQTHIEVT